MMSTVALELRVFLTNNRVDHRMADVLSRSLAAKIDAKQPLSPAETALIKAFSAASGDDARSTWPSNWKGYHLDGKGRDPVSTQRTSSNVSADIRAIAQAVPVSIRF